MTVSDMNGSRSDRTKTRARPLREFGITLSVLTLIMIGTMGLRLLLSLPLGAMR